MRVGKQAKHEDPSAILLRVRDPRHPDRPSEVSPEAWEWLLSLARNEGRSPTGMLARIVEDGARGVMTVRLTTPSPETRTPTVRR